MQTNRSGPDREIQITPAPAAMDHPITSATAPDIRGSIIARGISRAKNLGIESSAQSSETTKRPSDGTQIHAAKTGKTGSQPIGALGPDGHFRLEVLTPPEPGPPYTHFMDVVAVHDYDETSVNWAYRDTNTVLQQKINNIKTERMRLQDEPEKAIGADDHERQGRRPSVADPTKLDPGRLAPAPVSNQVTGGRDAASSQNNDAGSSRTPSPSGPASGPSWLQDAHMLPKALPGVRVLGFSYPTGDLKSLLDEGSDQSGQADFITKAASELGRHLKDARKPTPSIPVPIVLIGAGFGGLIVQKTISLLVIENGSSGGKDSEPSPLALDHLADVMFVDTPFPTRVEKSLDSFFPPSAANVRMTAIVKVVRRMEAEWDSPGVDNIFSEFWTSSCRHGQPSRVAWLYSNPATSASVGQVHVQNQKSPSPGPDTTTPVITLSQISLNRLHRLTNFGAPDDPGYRLAASRLQNSLMILAVRDSKLEDLQFSLMKAGSAVNTKDDWGVPLLHLAATAPNPSGVDILLRNGASSQIRDPDGQTPLHSAIAKFCELEDGGRGGNMVRDDLRTIIKLLLNFTKKSELYNSRNKRGQTPRDMVPDCDCVQESCKHDEIRELLNRHLPIVRRRLDGQQQEGPWKGWSLPREGSLQRKACERSEAIIAEFYAGEDGPIADYEQPTVFDLIYQKGEGPVKIVSKLAKYKVGRQVSQPVYCRWIHVPANNEQWIHDLFLRLRLRDSSINGQRHKGYTAFNRHMVTETKRFKKVTFPIPPAIQIQNHDLSRDVKAVASSSRGVEPPEGLEFEEMLRVDGDGWHGLDIPEKLKNMSEDIFVLFMPVLAFEEHRPRKRMTEAIQRTLKPLSSPGKLRRPSTVASQQSETKRGKSREPETDTTVVEAYLKSERPVHCRRTLDQYCYYMLDTTETRDRDQVVYKWARKQHQRASRDIDTGSSDARETHHWPLKSEVLDGTTIPGGMEDDHEHFKAKLRPIIMVDQLWLWILPDGTVVSSLPNTADPSKPFNLQRSLVAALFEDPDVAIKSVDDLTATILKNCVDFFRRDGPCGVKFHDCFQSSINDIAEEQARTYAKYENAVRSLEKLKDNKALQESRVREHTEIFSRITEETNRLVEIMDIQDELNIVDSVLMTQKIVLQQLVQMVTKRSQVQSEEIPDQPREITLRDSSHLRQAVHIVEENRSSIVEMTTSAKRVQENLKQLLDFKQQQSNAWEMWYSTKLAQQGRRQNNIILVFTLVTIVFLPLSFMSSFFAINVQEFPKDESGDISWPLGQLSAYLFGISVAVSVPLILAAFYVNDISRMARDRRDNKKSFLHLTGTSPSGSRLDHDSDDSDSETGQEQKREPKRKTGPDDDKEYAQLLGRFEFHAAVPFVRRLWKYYPYHLPELEGLDAGLEDLEWDYPLSRIRKKIAGPVEEALLWMGLRKLGMAYFGHETEYMLQRQPDALIKALLKEKMELREQERSAKKRWESRADEDSNSASSRRDGSEPGSRRRLGFRDAFSARRLRREVADEEAK